MSEDENIRETILLRAERLLHYNNLLIDQCNSWLSAKEGNLNMEKRIVDKRRKEEKQFIHNLIFFYNETKKLIFDFRV